MPTNFATKIYKLFKEGHIKFDGGHDVHTPQALVEEILNKINLDGEILVLFNVEFVVSLVYTFGIDASKITFYSDHPNKVKLLQKLGVTKYLDTLDTNMKFDVVIGNPPYQAGTTGSGSGNSIFDEFYYKAQTLTKQYIIFVAPTMWLTSTRKGLRALRASVYSHGLYMVDDINAQQTFGVKIDMCGVTYQDVTKSSSTFMYKLTDGSVVHVQKSEDIPVLTSGGAGIVTKVCTTPSLGAYCSYIPSLNRKGTSYTNEATPREDLDHPFKMINRVSSGNLEYVWTSVSKNDHRGMVRVAFGRLSTNTSLGTITILDDTSSTTSQNVVYVPVNSQPEANAVKAYLETKLFRYVLMQIRPGTTNSVGCINRIARPPLTQIWTDAELYAHFNLTQEEIDLIEATVK